MMFGWPTVYWLPLLFVGFHALLVNRNAIVARREVRDEGDFHVGGRRLGGVALGFSFFATFASNNSYVEFAGESYRAGASWLLIVCQINPISYMIDGFRYGLTGHADGYLWVGIVFVIGLATALWLVAHHMLRTGYKLKP
jgi:hypothetical protein